MRAVIYDPTTGAIAQVMEGGEEHIIASAVALTCSALDAGDVPDEQFYGGIDTTHAVTIGGEGPPQLEEIIP